MHPGTKLGKYVIEAFIGGGGFGRVYRATQLGPGGFRRPAAIKVLRAHKEDALQVFAREARIIARLQHRNIVQVQEFACEQDLYFMVMEYIDGVTLAYLTRHCSFRLPIWLGLTIGVDVCRALQYAHNLCDERGQLLGIVHRDIKPSNILISRQGDVKLTDFGLAKMSLVASDQLTEAGVVKGTPAYMSPEQWKGQPGTTASDVFSLAAVLYEMCTGQVMAQLSPRGAAGIPKFEMPSHFGLGAPPLLDEILLRALSPVPKERPDVAKLAEHLQEALAAIVPSGSLTRLNEELGEWLVRLSENGHAEKTETLAAQPVQVQAFVPKQVVEEAPATSLDMELPPPPAAASGPALDSYSDSLISGPTSFARSGPAASVANEVSIAPSRDEELRPRSRPGSRSGFSSKSLESLLLGDAATMMLDDESAARPAEEESPRGVPPPAAWPQPGLLSQDSVIGISGLVLDQAEDRQQPSVGGRYRSLLQIGGAAALTLSAALVVWLVAGYDVDSRPAGVPAPDGSHWADGAAQLARASDAGRLGHASGADRGHGDTAALHAMEEGPSDGVHQPLVRKSPHAAKVAKSSKVARSPRAPKAGPKAPGPKAPGPKAPASPKAPVIRATIASGPPAEAGRGLLSVSAIPWAQVYLDGSLIGTTPLYKQSVPSGSRTLRLVTEDKKELVKMVRIKPGELTNLGVLRPGKP